MWLRIFLLFFLITVISVAWHELTGGFQMQKVRFNLPENQKWHAELQQEEKKEVEKTLTQPFYYLAKGRQSYVFVSEDDKYVLKLFRYHLVRPRFGLHLCKWPKRLNNYRRYRIASKKRQFENWMNSYIIAYDKLKKETGLLTVHLTKTDYLPKKTVLYDRIGRAYTFDPNEVGFLIQKKTDLFLDVVQDLVRKKDEKSLTKLLSSYVDMVLARHFKGINNKDPSWLRNIGATKDQEVVEIDVGRYTFAPVVANKKSLQSYLRRYVVSLSDYFHKRFPEMEKKFNKLVDSKVEECNI